MFRTRTTSHALALAATTVLTIAATAATAHGAPCVSNHQTAVGGTWKVGANGALTAPVTPSDPSNGTSFGAGFGTLRVNGLPYPPVPGDGCTVNGTTVTYPVRPMGGLHVWRTVSVVDGSLRYVDTIVNATAQVRPTMVGLLYAVDPGQVPTDSEDHNDVLTTIDSWGVLKSTGTTHAFLRWRKGPSPQTQVDPHEPAVDWFWKPHLGVLDDATLRYTLTLQPFQTIRLMHWSGLRRTRQAAVAAAEDVPAALQGLDDVDLLNWDQP